MLATRRRSLIHNTRWKNWKRGTHVLFQPTFQCLNRLYTRQQQQRSSNFHPSNTTVYEEDDDGEEDEFEIMDEPTIDQKQDVVEVNAEQDDVEFFNSWFANDAPTEDDDLFNNTPIRMNSIMVKLTDSQGITAAEQYFKQFSHPSKLDYDQMVMNFAQVGDMKNAQFYFEKNRKLHFPHVPDAFSYTVFAYGYFKSGAYSTVIDILSHVSHLPTFTLRGYYMLILSYATLKHFERAIALIDTVHARGITLLNDHLYKPIILVCASSPDTMDIADTVYQKMMEHAVKPSRLTISAMLNGFIKVNDYKASLSIVYAMRRLGYVPQLSALPEVVKGLHASKEDTVRWFLLVFRMFPDMELTITLLRSLIASMQSEHFDKQDVRMLVDKLREMASEEVQEPTRKKVRQYNAIIHALAQTKDFSRVKNILELMNRQGIPILVSTRREVLYAASYCDLDQTLSLFNQERERLGHHKYLSYKHYRIVIRALLRFEEDANEQCLTLIDEVVSNTTAPNRIERLITDCFQYDAPETMLYILELLKERFPAYNIPENTWYNIVRTLLDNNLSKKATDLIIEHDQGAPAAPILSLIIEHMLEQNMSGDIYEMLDRIQFAPSSSTINQMLKNCRTFGLFSTMWQIAHIAYDRFPQSITTEFLKILLDPLNYYESKASQTIIPDNDIMEAQITLYNLANGKSARVREPVFHVDQERAEFVIRVYDDLRNRAWKQIDTFDKDLCTRLLSLITKFVSLRDHLLDILIDMQRERIRPSLQILILTKNLLDAEERNGMNSVPQPLRKAILQSYEFNVGQELEVTQLMIPCILRRKRPRPSSSSSHEKE